MKSDLKDSLVKEIANRVTEATGQSTELPSLRRAQNRDLTVLMMALKKQEVRQ
jgi:hypothetical protein